MASHGSPRTPGGIHRWFTSGMRSTGASWVSSIGRAPFSTLARGAIMAHTYLTSHTSVSEAPVRKERHAVIATYFPPDSPRFRAFRFMVTASMVGGIIWGLAHCIGI